MAITRKYSLVATVAVLFIASTAEVKVQAAKTKEKRQLPLSNTCDPRQPESCHKGDLISESIASCKKTSWIRTCDPIHDWPLSSVVNLPNVTKHGVNCVPDYSREMVCRSRGTDTRCVCDKAVDWKRLIVTVFHQCRCQYWPKIDIRKNRPSYCTQYDHGGISGVHFYICCNNCNDTDSSCTGRDYQGGGSQGDYCTRCGQNNPQGGGRATYSFNCVGCEQQAQCEEKCNRKYSGIYAKIPGFCPKWARCFRECCMEADAEQKMVAGLENYFY